jgi:hypothetical protein
VVSGGIRHEGFEYPDEQWYYYQMADRFGWTPEQTDNLPAGTADWLLAMASMIEEVKIEKSGG